MVENPFTPSFGTVPLVMAGRDKLLADMKRAFERKGRDPLLSTLLIGARGTGKTALLSCIREEAQQAGWLAVNCVAIAGLLEDVYEQALMGSAHLIESRSKMQFSSVGVGPLSVGWNQAETPQGNWRSRMTRLLDQLEEQGCGLLITVDEVKADLDEIVTLAAVYQLLVTENRRVSLVMAGLPYHVHRLVSHKTVSFLRRSWQYELDPVSRADVAFAFRSTFAESEKSIDDDALDLCVNAAKGFPYMIQLVGYRVWEEARSLDVVTSEQANRGIALALMEMDDRILAATYRELSPGDIRYLSAMLPDARESRTADIANRMGVTSGYASKYKARLLAQGIINEPARGWVAFEIPGFREYLKRREC